ncbi:hypothetical protein EDB83DRAFT_2406706 [Lactarius deliciosus]|nr:hypothetical protein EDB83DRAFT_2406706 [Lactarius deliciosus]
MPPPHRHRGAHPHPPLQLHARPPRSQSRRGRPPRGPVREGTLRTHAPPRNFGSTSGTPRPMATEATLPLGSRVNLTLSNDTIALVWISSDDATAVAAEGFRFTHAAPIHSI